MAIYDYELQHQLIGYVPCHINGLRPSNGTNRSHHAGVVKTSPLLTNLPALCRSNEMVFPEAAEVISINRRMHLSQIRDVVNLDLEAYGYRQFAGIMLSATDFTSCNSRLCPTDINRFSDIKLHEDRFDSSYSIRGGVSTLYVSLTPTTDNYITMVSDLRLGYTYIENVEQRAYIPCRDFEHGFLDTVGESENTVFAYIYTAAATDQHRNYTRKLRVQKDNIIAPRVTNTEEDELCRNLYTRISSHDVRQLKGVGTNGITARDYAIHKSDEDYLGRNTHWGNPFTKIQDLRIKKAMDEERNQKQLVLRGKDTVSKYGGIKPLTIVYSKLHNYIYKLSYYAGGLRNVEHTQHLNENDVVQVDFRLHSDCYRNLLVTYMRLTDKPVVSIPYLVRKHWFTLPKLC